MLADYDLPFELATLTVIFGGVIGLLFGVFAEQSKFCLRRALAGVGIDRLGAFSVWVTGFAVAMLATQVFIAMGWIDLSTHRLLSGNLPIVGVLLGGALFGLGMVLTRGCISRLTVLTGTGNLRALSVLIIFGLVANATLKGVLSPLRVWISSVSIPVGGVLPFAWVWVAVFVIAAAIYVARHPHHPWRIIGGGLMGLLVPITWYSVSVLLMDEFDPRPIEGLSFTLPHADTGFWIVASTAIPANFGVGLVGGVVAGGFVSALAFRRLEWHSFTDAPQMGRYMVGAVLMGFGGVLAGGCSVGAGLSGMSMLSVAAALALAAIIASGLVSGRRFP